MADKNYTFDPDSLSYKKNEQKKGRQFLISFLTQIVAAVFIGLLVFLAISYAIKTPGQKKTEQENAFMRQKYAQLSEKYKQADAIMEELKKRDRDIFRTVYESELPSVNTTPHYGNIDSSIGNHKLLQVITNLTDSSKKMLKNEESAFNELKFMLKDFKENPAEIPSLQPVADPDIEVMYYGFGQKLDPIYKTPKFHAGIDISAGIGTEVVASANGIIEYTGEGREYGKHIIIDHKNGYKTVYAHLSEYAVKKMQKVKRGDVIGFVGNTGKSLAPHLHYEISFKGQSVNPANYFFGNIGPAQYYKLKRLTEGGGLSLD